MEDREFEIRPYTKQELAKMYNKTTRTIYTWLKKIEYKIGKPIGHQYSVKQVEQIFSIWDLPEFTNPTNR
jgi:transposase